MENRTYLVTEAEKLTGEKAHVLRYWEDELGMEIHRNSLGHRCYTAQDIQIFLGIRELKKKGLHLKAIRELMPKLVQPCVQPPPGVLPVFGALSLLLILQALSFLPPYVWMPLMHLRSRYTQNA